LNDDENVMVRVRIGAFLLEAGGP